MQLYQRPILFLALSAIGLGLALCGGVENRRHDQALPGRQNNPTVVYHEGPDAFGHEDFLFLSDFLAGAQNLLVQFPNAIGLTF